MASVRNCQSVSPQTVLMEMNGMKKKTRKGREKGEVRERERERRICVGGNERIKQQVRMGLGPWIEGGRFQRERERM